MSGPPRTDSAVVREIQQRWRVKLEEPDGGNGNGNDNGNATASVASSRGQPAIEPAEHRRKLDTAPEFASAVLLVQCRYRQLCAERAVRAALAREARDTASDRSDVGAEGEPVPAQGWTPRPFNLSHIPNVEIVVTKSPKPQKVVSLDTLEHEMAIAVALGTDVLLNSPRSIEACRRAGIEAQQLLPPTLDDVMVDMRSVKAPPVILRTLATKRLHFLEKERRALLSLARNIRQRLIAGGFEPVRSLSPTRPSHSGAKPSSRNATPTREARQSAPQHAKSPSRMSEFEKRLNHTREARERIDEFLQRKAEIEADTVDRKIATAADRTYQLNAAKQRHIYCRAAEAIVTPHRHRTPSPASPHRKSPGASASRRPASHQRYFTEEHAVEVRERAAKIEALRLGTLLAVEGSRGLSIRTRSAGTLRGNVASRLSPSPQNRTHSRGYDSRLTAVQQRGHLIRETEQREATAVNRNVDARIQHALHRKTEAWSTARRASASRHDVRHLSAHRRRDLIRDLDERDVSEKQTSAERRLSQSTVRKLRSIEQFRSQLADHLREQRLRSERCASRARQMETVRVVETEQSLQAKEAAAEAFQERKLLALLTSIEDRRERELHRQRHAEQMRKAIDYMNATAVPRASVSPQSRRYSPRRAPP